MTTLKKRLSFHVSPRTVGLIVIVLLLCLQAVVVFGQTATPVPPTPTMVPLDFQIDTLMTSTNTWLATFAPIAAIGIGITLALAVLGYIGKMIISAFH